MKTGDLNAYFCPECKGYIVTVDRDEGTTPMFLACRVQGDLGPANTCLGQSRSMGYPPLETWPIEPEPTWEWHKPSRFEFAKLDLSARDYVRRGGLLLRKIESKGSRS